MNRVNNTIIIEADMHDLIWRLDDLLFEYHYFNGLKNNIDLVDLLDGSCTK